MGYSGSVKQPAGPLENHASEDEPGSEGAAFFIAGGSGPGARENAMPTRNEGIVFIAMAA